MPFGPGHPAHPAHPGALDSRLLDDVATIRLEVRPEQALSLVGADLASEQVGADLPDAGLVGELSLDGQVRSVTGMLPMAVAAKERGLTMLYVPQANAAEAALVEGLEVIPVASLASLSVLLARDDRAWGGDDPPGRGPRVRRGVRHRPWHSALGPEKNL